MSCILAASCLALIEIGLTPPNPTVHGIFSREPAMCGDSFFNPDGVRWPLLLAVVVVRPNENLEALRRLASVTDIP